MDTLVPRNVRIVALSQLAEKYLQMTLKDLGKAAAISAHATCAGWPHAPALAKRTQRLHAKAMHRMARANCLRRNIHE
jgi:uncharacterized protein (UPF0147 family)